MKNFVISITIILFVALLVILFIPLTESGSISQSGFSLIEDYVEEVNIHIEWNRRFRRLQIGPPTISGTLEIEYRGSTRELILDPINYANHVFSHGNFSVAFAHLWENTFNRATGVRIFFDNNFDNWAIDISTTFYGNDTRQYLLFSSTNKGPSEVMELFWLGDFACDISFQKGYFFGGNMLFRKYLESEYEKEN